MKEEDLYEIIPDNALDKWTFLTIPFQHWVEAFLTTGTIVILILSSVLVMKIKIICICVLGISNTVLFLKGIQNKSIFSFFINAIKTQRNKAEYHLGSINNERNTNYTEDFGKKSYAETIYSRSKKKFQEFDQKYGQ